MIKTIWKKMILRICSIEFWGIIVVFVFLMLLADAPASLDETRPSASLLYMLTHYSRAELAGMGGMMSAYEIIIRFREFKWLVVLFPVFVTYCGGEDFFQNVVCGMRISGETRTTGKRYIFINMMESVFVAVITFVISFLLFVCLIYLFFPSSASHLGTAENGAAVFSDGMTTWQRFLKCFAMSGNLLMMTVLYMVLVMALLYLLKDVFFAVSVPMIINYTGYMILNYHLAALIEKYDFNFPEKALWIEFINPVFLMDADYEFGNVFHLSAGWYFLIMAFFLGGMMLSEILWMSGRKV